MPGQKRTRAVRDSGTSTFSRVVVADWKIVGRRVPSAAVAGGGEPDASALRSSTDKSPSLFADATIGLPRARGASAGGLFTSQSCASRGTSWL